MKGRSGTKNLHALAVWSPCGLLLSHVAPLDLKPPQIDGFGVLLRIKKDCGLRSTPVVILTTPRAEMDKIRAYENNANSYLVKPMDFKVFEEVLREIGHYWSAYNQPAPFGAAAEADVVEPDAASRTTLAAPRERL